MKDNVYKSQGRAPISSFISETILERRKREQELSFPGKILKIDDLLLENNSISVQTSATGKNWYLDSENKLDYINIRVDYSIIIFKRVKWHLELVTNGMSLFNKLWSQVLLIEDFDMSSEINALETRTYTTQADNFFFLGAAIQSLITASFFGICGVNYNSNEPRIVTIDPFNEKLEEADYTETDKDSDEEKVFKKAVKNKLKENYNQKVLVLFNQKRIQDEALGNSLNVNETIAGAKTKAVKKNIATNAKLNNVFRRHEKKDSIEKDSIEKDSIEKDSIEKDSIEKDSIEKDSIEKDSIEKDSIEKP